MVMVASRRNGARIEREDVDGAKVIHNYGAGGAGYQSSWYVRTQLQGVSLHLSLTTHKGEWLVKLSTSYV
jgi:hypothetical protein